ncbi:MAG TPA: ParB/RepB/Spo0J family partition protein [Lacipirellulaceae bacterium]|nr:ParB/RepB/Spo0J family partition protein [Lacipirellulaceae bacterium]
MSKERRLGRGLEALLGRAWDDPQTSTTPLANTVETPGDERLSHDENGQVWLNCEAISRNPFQPRQTFDEAEIADLADSIRSHGILQPLVVRRSGTGFELIAGERRLRAAQAADWRQVPVQIRDVDDRQMSELAIVENVQRKDLNAIEKAESFQRYIDQYQCTQEELAGRVQVDRSTVANLLRLLELPASVKLMVQEGHISQGHARALLPLGDEQEQIEFAHKIKKEGLSVRATEQGIHDRIHALDGDQLRIVDAEGNSRPVPRPRNEQVASLEQELRSSLGTKVDLSQTAKGKGKITIHFQSREEFERLRQLLTTPSVSHVAPPQQHIA